MGADIITTTRSTQEGDTEMAGCSQVNGGMFSVQNFLYIISFGDMFYSKPFRFLLNLLGPPIFKRLFPIDLFLIINVFLQPRLITGGYQSWYQKYTVH